MLCMIKYKIKRKIIVVCEKLESVTSHDLYTPPPPCHKLSHFLRPTPPLWSVTYFMDGPLTPQRQKPLTRLSILLLLLLLLSESCSKICLRLIWRQWEPFMYIFYYSAVWKGTIFIKWWYVVILVYKNDDMLPF